MTARSADRHEQHAAAAMRRLVDAHENRRLSTATYRARRRRLLEAVTRGQPLLPQPLPPAALASPHAVWFLYGTLVVVALALALLAIWWWRSG